MVVTMQSEGHAIVGIRIGMAEARRFFGRGLHSIDLELDHLRINCDVRANSRLHRAEISDPRLTAWLEEKFYWRKLPSIPLSVELVKKGESYSLQLRPSDHETKQSFGLTV
jgi:hypothetical protein